MTKTPTYTSVALALTLFIVVLFLMLPSPTNEKPPAQAPEPVVEARTAVTEVDSKEELSIVAGQTVYVPSYSSIHATDRANAHFLAVTLTIRNTDRHQPILVTSAQYFDQEGRLVRDYLKKSIRIGPMASVDFFVPESETTSGVSASFLVEWAAEKKVHAPLIESVMLGSAGTQGLALTCPGRVLSERNRPDLTEATPSPPSPR